jgi:hypothetical protein
MGEQRVFQTREAIEEWIKHSSIKDSHYKIRNDLSVDVFDSVNLRDDIGCHRTELPFYFNNVWGDFIINDYVETLKGFPKFIFGNFNCDGQGATLENTDGFPKWIFGDCRFNFTYCKSITDLPNVKYIHHLNIKAWSDRCENTEIYAKNMQRVR